MTRMKLAVNGEPRQDTSWSPFKVLLLMFVGYIAIEHIFSAVIHPYVIINTEDGENDRNGFAYGGYIISPDAPDWVLCAVGVNDVIGLTFYVFVLYCIIKTRARIRRVYDIDEKCCYGCEDCCYAYWCPCCTVAQMGRHTADYRTYKADCCSETGLSPRAPPTILVSPNVV
jgi:Cys-rich protein (TIGR01571 family)